MSSAWMCGGILGAVEPTSIVSQLAIAAVVALVAAVIASYVTSRILPIQFRGLAASMDRMVKSADALDERLNKLSSGQETLRTERTACQLLAAHTYATREEFNSLLGEMKSNQHHAEIILDQLHEKVNGIANQVAEMRGAAAAERGTKP